MFVDDTIGGCEVGGSCNVAPTEKEGRSLVSVLLGTEVVLAVAVIATCVLPSFFVCAGEASSAEAAPVLPTVSLSEETRVLLAMWGHDELLCAGDLEAGFEPLRDRNSLSRNASASAETEVCRLLLAGTVFHVLNNTNTNDNINNNTNTDQDDGLARHATCAITAASSAAAGVVLVLVHAMFVYCFIAVEVTEPVNRFVAYLTEMTSEKAWGHMKPVPEFLSSKRLLSNASKKKARGKKNKGKRPPREQTQRSVNTRPIDELVGVVPMGHGLVEEGLAKRVEVPVNGTGRDLVDVSSAGGADDWDALSAFTDSEAGKGRPASQAGDTLHASTVSSAARQEKAKQASRSWSSQVIHLLPQCFLRLLGVVAHGAVREVSAMYTTAPALRARLIALLQVMDIMDDQVFDEDADELRLQEMDVDYDRCVSLSVSPADAAALAALGSSPRPGRRGATACTSEEQRDPTISALGILTPQIPHPNDSTSMPPMPSMDLTLVVDDVHGSLPLSPPSRMNTAASGNPMTLRKRISGLASSEGHVGWTAAESVFLCVKVRYAMKPAFSFPSNLPSVAGIPLPEASAHHAIIFEGLRDLARVFGARIEWSGSAEAQLCWLGALGTVTQTMPRVVAATKSVWQHLNGLAVSSGYAFVWGCGISASAAMQGRIRLKKSRMHVRGIVGAARDEAAELAKFAISIGAHILLLESGDVQFDESALKSVRAIPIVDVKSPVVGQRTVYTLLGNEIAERLPTKPLFDMVAAARRQDFSGGEALSRALLHAREEALNEAGIPIRWLFRHYSRVSSGHSDWPLKLLESGFANDVTRGLPLAYSRRISSKSGDLPAMPSLTLKSTESAGKTGNTIAEILRSAKKDRPGLTPDGQPINPSSPTTLTNSSAEGSPRPRKPPQPLFSQNNGTDSKPTTSTEDRPQESGTQRPAPDESDGAEPSPRRKKTKKKKKKRGKGDEADAASPSTPDFTDKQHGWDADKPNDPHSPVVGNVGASSVLEAGGKEDGSPHLGESAWSLIRTGKEEELDDDLNGSSTKTPDKIQEEGKEEGLGDDLNGSSTKTPDRIQEEGNAEGLANELNASTTETPESNQEEGKAAGDDQSSPSRQSLLNESAARSIRELAREADLEDALQQECSEHPTTAPTQSKAKEAVGDLSQRPAPATPASVRSESPQARWLTSKPSEDLSSGLNVTQQRSTKRISFSVPEVSGKRRPPTTALSVDTPSVQSILKTPPRSPNTSHMASSRMTNPLPNGKLTEAHDGKNSGAAMNGKQKEGLPAQLNELLSSVAEGLAKRSMHHSDSDDDAEHTQRRMGQEDSYDGFGKTDKSRKSVRLQGYPSLPGAAVSLHASRSPGDTTKQNWLKESLSNVEFVKTYNQPSPTASPATDLALVVPPAAQRANRAEAFSPAAHPRFHSSPALADDGPSSSDEQEESLAQSGTPAWLRNRVPSDTEPDSPGGDPEDELERFAAVFCRRALSSLVSDHSVGCWTTVTSAFVAADAVHWLSSRYPVSANTAVELLELLRSRGLFRAVRGPARTFVLPHSNAARDVTYYRFFDSMLKAALAAGSEGEDAVGEDEWVQEGALDRLLTGIADDEKLKTVMPDGSSLVPVAPRRALARMQKKFLVVRSDEQKEADRRNAIRTRYKNIWNSAKILLLAFNAVCIPLFTGYGMSFTFAIALFQWIADVLVYWISIVLRLFSQENYWKSSDFVLAVVACFPCELVAGMWNPAYVWLPLFRLNRLLNLTAFSQLFSEFVSIYMTDASSVKLQALKFSVLCSFVLHIVGSAFHFILWTSGLDSEESGNFYMGTPGFHDEPLHVQYPNCLDWAIRAMSGYGCRWPITDAQTVIVGAVQIAGVALWATIIAYVVVLIQSFNHAENEYEKVVDQLKEYMAERGLPDNFRSELLGYVKFLWETTRTYHLGQYDFLTQATIGEHLDAMSWSLPPELCSAFAFHMNEHVLDAVPLLAQGVNDNFNADVVSMLQPRVFTPGSEIVSYGDPGKYFYMITRGSVALVQDSTETVLHKGNFFGEFSILFDLPSPYKIVARTYCELYILDRQGLVWAALHYPHCLQKVLERAENAYAKYVGAPLPASQRSMYGAPSLRRPSLFQFQDMLHGAAPIAIRRASTLGTSRTTNPLVRQDTRTLGTPDFANARRRTHNRLHPGDGPRPSRSSLVSSVDSKLQGSPISNVQSAELP
ncbi:Cyclic nucleotide-gated cation channel subunit A [Diplonema papillatum]|nr:Cyclic nucleotide-gated cation channel subunit A [Diplonema papillatum]